MQKTIYLYLATSMLLLSSACAATNTSPILSETQAQNISAAEPVVIGNTYKIQSSVYKKERRLSIRVPVGYNKAEGKTFPVMYVIDGGPEQDFPHLAGMLQSVDLNYTLEPFILVGIETENRRYEITPPADDARYDELFQKRGGANEFRQYIRDEVMPWVKSNYRVTEDAGVIGESLGGLFVVDTFLNDSSLFNRYAAVSPSLWWDDLSITNRAAISFQRFPKAEKQLYLSIGNEGWKMQEGLDKLIKALQNANLKQVSWSYVDRSDSEDHASIYHPAALDAFRTFYSTPFRTGTSPSSFYMFPNGQAPELSDFAKKSIEKDCIKENAIVTSFAEVNADLHKWNGVCVLMKPGAKADLGN